MRINVLGVAPHIVTDFGEGDVRPGETEATAALRIYHAWCAGNGTDTVKPHPKPKIVLHDVSSNDR